MQPIHVLADQEAQETHAFQLHQRHVRLCGLGTLEGGVEFGRQAPFLHGPDPLGTPENRGQEIRELWGGGSWEQ